MIGDDGASFHEHVRGQQPVSHNGGRAVKHDP